MSEDREEKTERVTVAIEEQAKAQTAALADAMAHNGGLYIGYRKAVNDMLYFAALVLMFALLYRLSYEAK